MSKPLAVFVTVATALAGACLVQAFGLGASLLLQQWPAGTPRGLAWGWLAASGIAGVGGLLASYATARTGDARRPAWGLLLVPYSLAFKVGSYSFGWPFHCVVGMVLGGVGVSVNLLGLVMLACWLQFYHVPRDRRGRESPGVAAALDAAEPHGLA